MIGYISKLPMLILSVFFAVSAAGCVTGVKAPPTSRNVASVPLTRSPPTSPTKAPVPESAPVARPATTGPSVTAHGSNPPDRMTEVDFSELDLGEANVAKEMVFQEGDTLKVAVWGYPELDHIAEVQPNGMVTLPLTGEIRVSGLTISEVRKAIGEKLSPYAEIQVPE